MPVSSFPFRALVAVSLLALSACAPFSTPVARAGAPLVPVLDGPWWTVAGDPDLGAYTDPKQQPVDFAVWPAADGTWQLWSCIRGTRCGGKTRLLYQWEGRRLTDSDWTPKGIAMEADPAAGETPGGLQAPYTLRMDGLYHLFYGDWERICLAVGQDGKRFERRLDGGGRAGMFGEAPGANARDPMVVRVGDLHHCYYTAHPGGRGAVYCRTSPDLRVWSEARIVSAGGAAGSNAWSAECPFVARPPGSREWFLFRTQKYGGHAQTTVYRSPDPLDFGVDDDRHRIGTLPIAAPELVEHEGAWVVFALRPDLKGIQAARLRWARKGGQP
jgi:hypothetical protein